MAAELPTHLLVSVRSEVEAEAALEGGADVIDVKDPSRGPLGRADDETIAAVLRRVAGRRPVSAALGELSDNCALPAVAGLAFVKWGLAGSATNRNWREVLRRMFTGSSGAAAPRVVIAAYADWEEAAAPPVAEVLGQVVEHAGCVFLLDTYCKVPHASQARAPTLLDSLTIDELVRLCAYCRASDVKVALAGSLGTEHIPLVLQARPNWLAFRAAACRGGRGGTVCASRVHHLAALLKAAKGSRT
jgi:uncharacterized protein (UPF0264 family)